MKQIDKFLAVLVDPTGTKIAQLLSLNSFNLKFEQGTSEQCFIGKNEVSVFSFIFLGYKKYCHSLAWILG